jgi:hypothetical protein
MWQNWLPSLPPYPDNPLFKYEIRQVRWAETPTRLKHYVIVAFCAVQLVIVLLWLLAALRIPRASYRYPDQFLGVIGELVGPLILISIGANGLLDLGCILMTANSFVGEIAARRWDLTRLAALNAGMIVDGKYRVALCRVWRLAALVISLRIAVVLLFILAFALSLILHGVGDLAPEVITALLAMIFVALVYIVEPHWRAQSFTARFLEVSYGKSTFLGVIGAALLGAVSLWFLQAILFGVVVFVSGWLTISVLVNAPFLGVILFFFACLGIAFSLWWFYQAVGGDNRLQNLTFRLNHDLADFN